MTDGKVRSDRGMYSLPARDVVSRSDLLALGWSDAAMKRAARSGRLIRALPGVYALPETPHMPVRAALLIRPDGVGSVRSAARIHELPVLGPPEQMPEITVPPSAPVRSAGMHVYRATLPSQHVAEVCGIRVTTIARTAIDVARHRPLPHSVALIDAALHAGSVSVDELADVERFCWNWPGIGRAHRAVRAADHLAESPLESISRVAMTHLSIPAPSTQRIIRDEHGRFVARVDFYWDEFGIVGEADGAMKYAGRPGVVVAADRDREEWLEDLGIVVFRWGWDEATHRPHLIRRRFEHAVERAQLLRRSGLCRKWTTSAPSGSTRSARS